MIFAMKVRDHRTPAGSATGSFDEGSSRRGLIPVIILNSYLGNFGVVLGRKLRHIPWS
jgi:hypothetical protein